MSSRPRSLRLAGADATGSRRIHERLRVSPQEVQMVDMDYVSMMGNAEDEAKLR